MIEHLLSDPDPIVRYKTRVHVLGLDPQLPEIRQIQEEIRSCERIRKLLSDCNERGEIPFHPYTKWQGAHWALTVLADCGYPPGDQTLLPLRDQVYAWLFSDEHLAEIHRRSKNHLQVRLHASMEANAMFASLALGLVDERTPELLNRLLWAQWEDGGWNCDRRKNADTSSFYESITPLRALARFIREPGNSGILPTRKAEVQAAVDRCAEIFLKRRLFRRISDGEIMRTNFLKPRTPTFWFYDILFALKVMSEAGFIQDPRCQEALDVLESKRLPGGWFSAEGKHYVVYGTPGKALHGGIRVGWGPTNGKPNPFITIDALYVLRAAGRWVAD
jgi:hypothetical protein